MNGMRMRLVATLTVVAGMVSGCMTHTPRVLPPNHGLTAETAVETIRSALGQGPDALLAPGVTRTHFRYWGTLPGAPSTSLFIPPEYARYVDIKDVFIETFIWISPGNPFLDTKVRVAMKNWTSFEIKPVPTCGDALNILPPFWFFDPKRRVHKAERLADSFLLLRELQRGSTNHAEQASAETMKP